MVIGAFPAAKLGALLLKQISKPIANVVKNQAKSSPIFRKYVCMPPAQFYNWCEVKAKMWILNLGKPVNIPVLSESMAIELGANLLGLGYKRFNFTLHREKYGTQSVITYGRKSQEQHDHFLLVSTPRDQSKMVTSQMPT
ncbi:unnamed protein product [Acanthoscelides obtectus]|uniref:Uncharacterized protein n=1 Tax=Acanthoscelides obtectus TaxID=200917 RepID=A0A9P0M200_ACAOB|nr:unnamed protein product [Acanthoscelides obtectus]CAK1624301.1 Putative OPA3-like protein CG13603 [Acanthoscelides obtectus]